MSTLFIKTKIKWGCPATLESSKTQHTLPVQRIISNNNEEVDRPVKS